jgi:hypothetical protein
MTATRTTPRIKPTNKLTTRMVICCCGAPNWVTFNGTTCACGIILQLENFKVGRYTDTRPLALVPDDYPKQLDKLPMPIYVESIMHAYYQAEHEVAQ